MLAIVPQFLRPGAMPLWMQAVELGAIITVTQTTVYGDLTLVADHARRWLAGSARAQLALARAVGVLLLAAAVATGLDGWRGR